MISAVTCQTCHFTRVSFNLLVDSFSRPQNIDPAQELDPHSSDQLLLRLSDATVDAMRLEISERAANRRGLRPIDGDDDGSSGTGRRRPLPPLPPEVKAARDALAAKVPWLPWLPWLDFHVPHHVEGFLHFLHVSSSHAFG